MNVEKRIRLKSAGPIVRMAIGLFLAVFNLALGAGFKSDEGVTLFILSMVGVLLLISGLIPFVRALIPAGLEKYALDGLDKIPAEYVYYPEGKELDVTRVDGGLGPRIDQYKVMIQRESYRSFYVPAQKLMKSNKEVPEKEKYSKKAATATLAAWYDALTNKK